MTLIQASKTNNLQNKRITSPVSLVGCLSSGATIRSVAKPQQRLTSFNVYNFGTEMKTQKINMGVLNVAFHLISLDGRQEFNEMI